MTKTGISPILTVFIVQLLLISKYITVECKDQYVEPLNMGMKMNVPYDIGNIFSRPISGTLGVAMSIGFAFMLLIGVITSPFGYMFGIPSRKYVLGKDSVNSTDEMDYGPDSTRSFPSEDFLEDMIRSESARGDGVSFQRIANRFLEMMDNEYEPEFTSSMFALMHSMDVNCQLLTTCFAHGGMAHLPKGLVGLYRKFSRKLTNIPLDFQDAIVTGMKDRDSCVDKYEQCNDNLVGILMKTFFQYWPESMQKLPRRKQAMYM